MRTIGQATLHHMAMANQRYLNWAAMVTHYMRAHGQWLRMGCQGVEEVYLASFRKTSREFWREYGRVRDWCYHRYAQAGGRKSVLFSQAVSMSALQHLATQAARWTATSDHWLASAWSQKVRHLAAEAGIVRRLLLKRKRAPLLEGTRGKHSRSHEKGDTCAVQLTRSPVRQAFHHADGIQLTGSPIRWDVAG